MAVGTEGERVPRWAGALELLLGRTTLPLLDYNFPRHTRAPITPGLIGSPAAEYPLLAGVKHSETDRGVTRDYADTGVSVFIGSDGAAAHIADPAADDVQSQEIRTHLRTKILPQMDPSRS